MSISTVAVPCCAPLTREPLDRDGADRLAGMFKALGDPVRLRLLSLIASHVDGEACACDLQAAFDVSQPTLSHHLRVLVDAGLLDRDKRGVWAYYRVRADALAGLAQLLNA